MKCAVCEFNFDDTASKCPFCGHVVGAVLPERTAPAVTPPAMAAPPSEWATQPPPVTLSGYAGAPATAPNDPAAFATQPAPAMMGAYDTPAATAYPATATATATAPATESSAGLIARLAIAALAGVVLGAVAFLIVLLLRG